MAIPIILIHDGNSRYLFDTLYQLRLSNAASQVFILGTPETRIYSSLITHVLAKEYDAEAQEFKKYYRHFSTNPEEFELICLQRWFVLKAFMQARKFTQCLYLDSDVLLYSGADSLAKRLPPVGMTVCGISGHTNFVHIEVLTEFCAFIFESYSAEKVELLKAKYEKFISSHSAGGISDMTFFTEFRQMFPEKIIDISHFAKNQAFDITIDTGIGEYKMLDGRKEISWKSGKPFCIRLADEQRVMHHTLHFQGAAKAIIGEYVTAKGFKYRAWRKFYLARYLVQKLQSKLIGS